MAAELYSNPVTDYMGHSPGLKNAYRLINTVGKIGGYKQYGKDFEQLSREAEFLDIDINLQRRNKAIIKISQENKEACIALRILADKIEAKLDGLPYA